MTSSKASPKKSIELFTGAGGLALGVARAGFAHTALIEWNRDACDSLRRNASTVPEMSDWPVHKCDVRDIDFSRHEGQVTLIAAGAPCQPFSLGGKHHGDADARNMFPQVFRAVRDIAPEVVIVENVKGLLRTSFRPYFDYILRQLQAPELTCPRDSEWRDHDALLRRRILRGRSGRLTYDVHHQLLNAADFGVPQTRERVFIVALRSDLGLKWKDLAPTHSAEALTIAKWIDGTYWREHRLKRRPTPAAVAKRVERLSAMSDRFFLDGRERWRTVRDAFAGLPEPKDRRESTKFLNHVGNPGARSYPGHTGSPLDEPAKTLKAGDHGVPGGENMLRRDDGSVRYFTVREAARLQGFPDEYSFAGAWSEGFRQLGNAVPVRLAEAVARHVREILEGAPSLQSTKHPERVA